MGEFWDEGFSAYSGNRGPDLRRAEAAAEKAAQEYGTTAMLIVQHSDRLARGAGDKPGASDSLVEVWHRLRRKDVHVRSYQNDSMMGDAVLVAVAAKQAHEESQRKSDAIKSGKRRKVAERGGTNGPLTFGYRFDDPDSVNRKRIPDPDKVPILHHLAEMLHEGKNFADMCRWLNAHGHRTKRGNTFAPQRVRDLLANPYYAGKVKLPDGGLVDGTHEAIFSWEEHERICAELEAVSNASNARGGRSPARPILLTGVMRCAHCGRGVWHKFYESGRREYLCGNVRQLSGLCDAAPIDAPTLERAVVDHLGGLFVDLGAWIERVSERRADERQILEREAAGLMGEREGLERDEALVRADYMKQLRAGNEAAAKIAATEIERIEGERADLGAKLADVEARIGEWDGGDSANEALDWWTEFSQAVRGEIVNSDSIADANAAFKERFAAIFVHSPAEGSPRLDFVLKQRPPGMPLVSSRLWVDDPEALPEDGTLIDFLGEEPEEADPVKLVGSLLSGYSRSGCRSQRRNSPQQAGRERAALPASDAAGPRDCGRRPRGARPAHLDPRPAKAARPAGRPRAPPATLAGVGRVAARDCGAPPAPRASSRSGSSGSARWDRWSVLWSGQSPGRAGRHPRHRRRRVSSAAPSCAARTRSGRLAQPPLVCERPRAAAARYLPTGSRLPPKHVLPIGAPVSSLPPLGRVVGCLVRKLHGLRAGGPTPGGR